MLILEFAVEGAVMNSLLSGAFVVAGAQFARKAGAINVASIPTMGGALATSATCG